MSIPRPRVILLVLAGLLLPALATSQTKLLRFPDIHGDMIVFCYAGDIWRVGTSGGTAVRLTTHNGQEIFPKISPDGEWIAFTGQYDGDEQVYIIPSSGGVPKQLTFYPARGPLSPRWGFDNQVYGWTRDGEGVLFRSMRYGWDLTDTQLFTVTVEGGLPVAMPMPVSGAGDYSPDGNWIVYSPLVRDFRTWKRYQGGWAQDLYIFNLKTYEATQITSHPRSDRDPMWIDEKVFFTSDRDGTLNIYSFEIASGDFEQLTFGDGFDVRWPSADETGQIVYELGGELRILDVRSGNAMDVTINVPNDGVAMRPSRVSAADNIEHSGLSPKGERVVFAARGDIFTAPIEKGPTRNLTRSSNAHDKWPNWSHDGKKIVFISDWDGEEELYLIDQDGKSKMEQITDGGKAMRYRPLWSPDGDHIAFSDKNGKLFLLEVKSKKVREIADEKIGTVRDYTWSPQGGYLAFSMNDESGFGSIYIWSVKEKKLRRITGPYFNESEPVWDPNGDYLYYFADRQFAPQIGSLEWNYVVDRETGIYALALRKDVKHPFPPQSDEVSTESEDKDEDKDDDDKKDKKKKEFISIDFEALSDRVARVPVKEDNYYNLNAIDGNLVYVRGRAFYYGRSSDVKPSLRIYSIEDREEETIVDDMSNYVLSRDGKKALVRSDSKYKLYDAKASPDDPKTISTDGLMVDRIPAAEWAQIYNEVWRRFRDFFYVENMHGYDWEAIGNQYRDLLPYVAHRSDLNYVIGEVIAELSVSHAYISGGDYNIPDRPKVALPGARFELDDLSDRYRIVKILYGQNEEPRYRSPLTEIGVNINEGDYILAIDGEELTSGKNPYQLLRNKADRPVELTVSAKPGSKDTRRVTFAPITNERSLVYLAWVEHNRDYVAEKTRGRVGYLHIPDMGSSGIREFIKWYYPQIRKEGLVIDVRGNGGGNVSQMLIERLRRELLSVDYSRNRRFTGANGMSVSARKT